jgi:hypothetical protein
VPVTLTNLALLTLVIQADVAMKIQKVNTALFIILPINDVIHARSQAHRPSCRRWGLSRHINDFVTSPKARTHSAKLAQFMSKIMKHATSDLHIRRQNKGDASFILISPGTVWARTPVTGENSKNVPTALSFSESLFLHSSKVLYK